MSTEHTPNPTPAAEEPPPTARLLPAALLVGGLAGSASALFLISLDWVSARRLETPGLLWGLPAAGLLMAFVYRAFGKNSDRGNNLLLDQIHQPGAGVPRRMAPLVLASTLLSHLCGASVGREGTAVQMGGSLASAAARGLRLSPGALPSVLQCGMAAGFGSVFGTPLAGALFALEVPRRGGLHGHAWMPLLVASFTGDLVCRAWGATHTAYPTLPFPGADSTAGLLVLLGKVILAGGLFGLLGAGFVRLTHRIQSLFGQWIPLWWLRPLAGGSLVLAMAGLLGTRDYLGLGVSHPDPAAITLQSAFTQGGATTWSWLWKMLFTALSLGSGFKGGEVTPLFFIGAAAGNTMASALSAPTPLCAALGFISVFCGAAHTPLTGALLGAELFGWQCVPWFLLSCWTAHRLCGSSQLYAAQRPSLPTPPPAPPTS
ncbi:MAG: hypothetical protein RLZZ142_1082 [Verrucomicrobiota bacterium]